MGFITSVAPSVNSRTTSHAFVVGKSKRACFSSYHPIKLLSRVKVSARASGNSYHGKPLSGTIVIRRPKLVASCACLDKSQLYHAALSPFSDHRSCGIGFVRTCSTATSVAPSSLRPLVLPSSAPLVITSQIGHSHAPQKSEEWFALRKDKLTTSTFSTALGFWKGNRRNELWREKVFPSGTDSFTLAAKSAMNWGVVNESVAIERYKSITGRDVSFLGFAVHSETNFQWIGASPDGLLGENPGGGILEVKCPYNKGKPELALPWTTVPFYYMPQVQGQMEVLDRDWVDLYCWTPNGSTVFRVCRERGYWDLINGILREFWWENVVPARELMSLGREEDAHALKPSSTHKQTGLAIVKSLHLAAQAKMLCREIAGHVEFFS